MATHDELKEIAEARKEAARLLLVGKDFIGAAYMMGWALECALKAVICKTLHLGTYPERCKEDAGGFFLTHRFDRLLMVSGLQDVFGVQSGDNNVWSGFTQEYLGEWPDIRYDLERQRQFDEKKVNQLYGFLDSVFKKIDEKNRW